MKLSHGQKGFVVAEGPETALSLLKSSPDKTVLATLSVSNMKNLALPKSSETTIAKDKQKTRGSQLPLAKSIVKDKGKNIGISL